MSEHSYDPKVIEQQAQAFWQAHDSFKALDDPSLPKFYCLSMFPYPSGKLHMGHVRNYTIGDVISRYQRMRGRNVLQPMGWDAFGLPAEGAAIRHGKAPAEWTYQNIDDMKGQLTRLGFGYDWSRELATCRPEYYRWEQWLFTRLHEKGLAYRRNAVVNWDPVDQTVLANEQVIDGRGWRSGALVERREIPQWFLRITDYAEELLDYIDKMPGWPESVRKMQRNWIGRSEGLELSFEVDGAEALHVYTTRPDTLMGVSYLAVAAEHPLALAAAKTQPKLQAFLEQCHQGAVDEASLETMEKRGMALGIDAIHPLSGERVPVWVANFVLMGYGTGAVMAVPGHDQRDWEFAHRYDLPIRQVIASTEGSEVDLAQGAYVDKGVLVNSGRFDGLDFPAAFDAIAEALGARAQRRVNYRLRDWGVSRQRYWGAPIPMLYGDDGHVYPERDAQLPVTLPEDVTLDGGGSPLARREDFLRATLADGSPARRETDTFDTFMESSWYYARFCCADNDQAMLDERARYWLPVDQYVGGIEHAILHLLYARFYHKVLRDLDLVDCDEPFDRLLTQGMVVAETYYREADNGARTWYAPRDIEVIRDERGRAIEARLREDGRPVIIGDVEKMSKSKNNGVDPQDLIDRYGADTVRLYTMFAAPPEQSLEWTDSGVEGAYRFLRRLWTFADSHRATLMVELPDPATLDATARELRCQLYETLGTALADFERNQYNTVVAACMKLLNLLGESGAVALHREGFNILLRLLSPIAPHICHTLWRELGYGDDILRAGWPSVDTEALVRSRITLSVQVNGKMRGRIEVDAEANHDAIRDCALADVNVQRFIGDKTLRKCIVVPGRLVNLVVG